MIKTLEYGEFNNVFEIRRFLNPGPICPPNFYWDNLHHNLILFSFLLETKHWMKAYDITTHYLDQQFDKPSGRFAESPENDECFFIQIHQDFSNFNYDPIVQDAPHPVAPKWTLAFVDFINFAVKLKSGTIFVPTQSCKTECMRTIGIPALHWHFFTTDWDCC